MVDKESLANDLAEYLRSSGIDREALAEQAGVHPSKVSRILTGDYRLLSKKLRLVCAAAKLEPDRYEVEVDPAQSPHLMAALRKVWDGSPRQAAALAAVIRSLRHLDATQGINLRRRTGDR